MAWTYSGDPTSSQKDEVRFLIGDTIASDPLLQDAEVNYCLAQEPMSLLAAALACVAISSLYSRLADSRIGDVQQSMSQKSKQYAELALELRRRAAVSATPTFGGISHSVKDTLNQDTDLVQPDFARGMDDIPGAPQSNVPLNTDPFLETP